MKIKQFTLSKRMILRKNDQFQAVYQSGKSYANRMMALYVFLPEDSKQKKAGFAAGKRLGNAVVRNRAKRLLREAYRLNQHKLKDDVVLILMARQMMKLADCQAVNQAFLDLCRRAKILQRG